MLRQGFSASCFERGSGHTFDGGAATNWRQHSTFSSSDLRTPPLSLAPSPPPLLQHYVSPYF